jgi:hypothetical protein
MVLAALPDESVFLPLRVTMQTGIGLEKSDLSETANGPNNDRGTTSSISKLNSAQRA